VDGHVVEDRDLSGRRVDLDDADVGEEAVGGGRGDAILGVRRAEAALLYTMGRDLAGAYDSK